MIDITFPAPMVNKVTTDLELIGYDYVTGWTSTDSLGRPVTTKVLFCSRNNIQVTISTTDFKDNGVNYEL